MANVIYITECYLNDKTFRMYYNEDNNRYYFREFKNDLEYAPSKEDLRLLNATFNKKGNYINSSKSRRKVTAVKNVTSLVLVTAISLASIHEANMIVLEKLNANIENIGNSIENGMDNILDLLKEGVISLRNSKLSSQLHQQSKDYEYVMLEDIDTNELYDSFITAINNNSNLDDNIKSTLIKGKFLKNLCDYYGAYLDQEEIVSKLSTLTVNYKDEVIEQQREFDDVLTARYLPIDNAIDLVEINKGDSITPSDRLVLNHEISHLTEKRSELGTALREGIDERIVHICNQTTAQQAYERQQNYANLIGLLVGDDVLFRFYYQDDSVLLTNFLSLIYGNRTTAVRLLTLMDTINDLDRNISQAQVDIDNEKETQYTKVLEHSIKTREKHINDFLELYDLYYQNKFGKSYMDSPYVRAVLDVVPTDELLDAQDKMYSVDVTFDESIWSNRVPTLFPTTIAKDYIYHDHISDHEHIILTTKVNRDTDELIFLQDDELVEQRINLIQSYQNERKGRVYNYVR